MIKHIFKATVLLSLLSACTQESGQQDQKISEANETDHSKNSGIIQIADQTLEVDARSGGRIKGISIDGFNFLTGREINADNWGSTFWPSPQSAWGWPPSEEIDKKEYDAVYEDTKILMTSAVDSKQGFVVEKSIEGNERDTSFSVTYAIVNQTDSAQKVSPWEISRVRPGGLTFYPTGKDTKKGDLAPLTNDLNGVTWFAYDSATIPDGVPKLLADGAEGWLAQINGRYILIKSFDDVPSNLQAPGEGEIELYANPDRSYIEIEQQGSYLEVKPGQKYEWKVKWILRRLPDSIKAEPGSPELIAYVRSLIQ